MSLENPLWGAPKIHGELLKLGIEGRPVHSFDLYGAPAGPTIADLEDLPSQSYGGDCIDRSLCGSDDYVPMFSVPIPSEYSEREPRFARAGPGRAVQCLRERCVTIHLFLRSPQHLANKPAQ